jgi:hypothetical protein
MGGWGKSPTYAPQTEKATHVRRLPLLVSPNRYRIARQTVPKPRLLRQAAPMGADMLDAPEPNARVAPDPDVSGHALLLLEEGCT